MRHVDQVRERSAALGAAVGAGRRRSSTPTAAAGLRAPGASDAAARRTWHAYHLIGDVLRSEDLASTPARDAALPRRAARAARRASRWCWRRSRRPRGASPAAPGVAPRSAGAGCVAVGGRRRLRRWWSAPSSLSRAGRRLAAPAATLPPSVAPQRVGRRRCQAAVREPAAPSRRPVAVERQDDPRRAARPLSGGAQAVRRQLGARRAFRLPAQRDGRRRPIADAMPTPPACCRARSFRSACACAASARPLPAALAQAEPRRRRRAAGARGARLADAHPRGRQPAQLPGHLRRQRRRHGVERAHRALLRRREPVRAHRVARRPGAPACSATTTSCTRCGRPAQVAMVEQRDLLSSFPALLQAGDDRIAEFVRGARAGRRARRRPRGQRARCVKPRDALPLRLPPVGRPGHRAAAARRRARRARRGARDRRRSPRSRSACKPQPETVLQPMKKLDGYRVRAAGADARPGSRPKAGRCASRCPGFRQVSCVKRPMDNAGEPRATRTRAGAADDLLRRPDLRLGLHRAVRRRSATPRPMLASASARRRR